MMEDRGISPAVPPLMRSACHKAACPPTATELSELNFAFLLSVYAASAARASFFAASCPAFRNPSGMYFRSSPSLVLTFAKRSANLMVVPRTAFDLPKFSAGTGTMTPVPEEAGTERGAAAIVLPGVRSTTPLFSILVWVTAIYSLGLVPSLNSFISRTTGTMSEPSLNALDST